MSNYWDEMVDEQEGQKSGSRPKANIGINVPAGDHKATLGGVKFTSDDEEGEKLTLEYIIAEGEAKGAVVKDKYLLDNAKTEWKRKILVSNMIDMGIDVKLLKTKSGRQQIADGGVVVKINVSYKDNPGGKFPYRNIKFIECLSQFKSTSAPPQLTADEDGYDTTDGDEPLVSDKWGEMNRKELISYIVADADRKTAIGAKRNWTDDELREAIRKYEDEQNEVGIPLDDDLDLGDDDLDLDGETFE